MCNCLSMKHTCILIRNKLLKIIFSFPFFLSFSFTFYSSSLFNVSSFRVFVLTFSINEFKQGRNCLSMGRIKYVKDMFLYVHFYIIFDFVLTSNCAFTCFFLNCVSASNTMWSNLEHVWNRWLSRISYAHESLMCMSVSLERTKNFFLLVVVGVYKEQCIVVF